MHTSISIDTYYSEIDTLSKVAFPCHLLIPLFQKYSIPQLIELIDHKPKSPIVVDYISALLTHHYQEIILSPTGFQFTQTLLSHKDKKLRALLSECLETHYYEFATLLCQLHQTNSPTLPLILQVLFYQLQDPTPEVGLKALRVAKKLFHKQTEQVTLLMLSDIFADHINQGLQSQNEVVQLRFVELLIAYTNGDQQVHNKYQPLFTIVFKLYGTNDLLVKLNMIEIMADMGNSKWNAQLLTTQKFFKDILTESFSDQVEFYVRKYQVILLSKLLKQRVTKSTPEVEKKLMQLLRKWLTSNSTEEIEGAFEVMLHFTSYNEGFKQIVNDRDFLAIYFQFAHTTKETIKKKFLGSFAGFFIHDVDIPKPPGKVCWLYSLLSSQKLISVDYEVGLMKSATDYMIAQLHSPFAEIEQLSLEILKYLILWEEIFKSLIADEKFKGYFVKHSQNKEILDAKEAITNEIWLLCQTQYKQDHYVSFANELKNQRKQTQMQYKTDVQ